MSTAAAWETLHQERRHHLRYPSEHVVRWLASVPATGNGYALDIGCGNGRHLRVLRDFGWATTGVDVSARALASTGVLVDIGVQVADMTDLPFDTGTFDIAISDGVFYYGTMGTADAAVAEMYRVLKTGGRGFVSYRSVRDWRGDHIDAEGYFHLEGHPEDGMLIDTVNEDELIALFAEFSDMRWELAEWTTHDRDRLNSDWLVSVTK